MDLKSLNILVIEHCIKIVELEWYIVLKPPVNEKCQAVSNVFVLVSFAFGQEWPLSHMHLHPWSRGLFVWILILYLLLLSIRIKLDLIGEVFEFESFYMFCVSANLTCSFYFPLNCALISGLMSSWMWSHFSTDRNFTFISRPRLYQDTHLVSKFIW